MASPASGVDFDRNRLSQGELIAGIAGIVLLIDLWFKWYGVTVSAPGGALRGFNFGVSADAWQVFSWIDILLFLISLIAIGVAALRGLGRMPDMPYSPATLVAGAGGLAVLLILFRIIDSPVDTHGVSGIDVSRKFGIWLGLLAAAAITYGGWRAMQESGASIGGLGAARGAPGAGAGANEPTTPMPATGGDNPGVPGRGAAGVSPGKEGPGAPHPGTSTGAPGDEGGGPVSPAAGADPGAGAPQTPPGLAGEPPAGEGTTPAGL
jgi:hypothetical protein